MGWKKANQSRPQIRGFLPFTEDASATGIVTEARIKEDGRGYYLIQLTEEAIVNVRDAESKTGQGIAKAGDIIGVRKTSCTRVLGDLIGRMVRVTYNKTDEREGKNQETGKTETRLYHDISVDVYVEEKAGE